MNNYKMLEEMARSIKILHDGADDAESVKIELKFAYVSLSSKKNAICSDETLKAALNDIKYTSEHLKEQIKIEITEMSPNEIKAKIKSQPEVTKPHEEQ